MLGGLDEEDLESCGRSGRPYLVSIPKSTSGSNLVRVG